MIARLFVSCCAFVYLLVVVCTESQAQKVMLVLQKPFSV